jgi:CTP:molybdopterin cytidylyltransferase MocA
LQSRAATACVITLVDQPLIDVQAVRRLLDAAGDADVAVATYDGVPLHPVLLDRTVWSGVSDLAVGDIGAKAWMRLHPARVLNVPCDGLGSAVDIDTPADLAAVRAAAAVGKTR